LEQLKSVLQQFGIPFVVAQDEPHAGRPISQKVKDLMDSCTGGIFIFTADEEFTDASGVPIRRPRENVIFELGAASYLYGRSIVIFKEDSVSFPSDFSDLGWISFEKDRLDLKAMELMKELISLGALRLVAGAR
jgi:predicted nucleotide-binding protein